MKFDKGFYCGKRVLITGHTGFKGSWMCKLLDMVGADVTGYALEAEKNALFDIANLNERVKSITGDIRDIEHMRQVFNEVQPQIVIHMAAQPIVRESYKNPVYTYETNVMGTVNTLECVRNCQSVRSVINVTTDKVYKNKEWEWGYRENDELNGYDPYSNSKSCSELITSSYVRSFFSDMDIAATTCRAGNVIGGGDFAVDRIIPDCVRAVIDNKDIVVRNPYSVRPYQHVLEPVVAYLVIAQEQYNRCKFAGNYNIGPYETDCITTGELVNLFCEKWNKRTSLHTKWTCVQNDGPHEAKFLKLDCSKIKSSIGWKPKWNVEMAVEKVVEWTYCYVNKGNIEECMEKQIEEYLK